MMGKNAVCSFVTLATWGIINKSQRTTRHKENYNVTKKNKKTQSLSTTVYSISSSRINVTNLPIRKLVWAQLKHESIFYLKNASGVPFIETQIPSYDISSTAPPPHICSHMNFHYSIVWGGNQEIFTKIKSWLFSSEMIRMNI